MTPSSENVRLGMPFLFRVLIRVLALLAPKWTAKKLVQRATIRPAAPDKIGRLPDCESLTGLEVDGQPFWVLQYGPKDGPRIYLVHGWYGSHADFAAVVPALAQSGYRVLLVEAPGHGASPGRKSDVGLLVRAYQKAVETFGPPRATIGHSVGALAVGVASGDGVNTGQLVLVSPFLDPEWWLGILNHLGGRRLREEVSALLTQQMGRTPESLTLHRARLDPNTLIIHDQNDRTVPHEPVRTFAERRGVWFKSTAGLGHRRILFHPGVTLAILRHLEGHLR